SFPQNDRTSGTIDPPPDGAHAVGAPLRPPSGDLRYAPTALPRASANPRVCEVHHGLVDRLPHHPHIQHADLGITSAYLRGIDNTEIIHAVHERLAPMIPAGSTLAPHR